MKSNGFRCSVFAIPYILFLSGCGQDSSTKSVENSLSAVARTPNIYFASAVPMIFSGTAPHLTTNPTSFDFDLSLITQTASQVQADGFEVMLAGLEDSEFEYVQGYRIPHPVLREAQLKNAAKLAVSFRRTRPKSSIVLGGVLGPTGSAVARATRQAGVLKDLRRVLDAARTAKTPGFGWSEDDTVVNTKIDTWLDKDFMRQLCSAVKKARSEGVPFELNAVGYCYDNSAINRTHVRAAKDLMVSVGDTQRYLANVTGQDGDYGHFLASYLGEVEADPNTRGCFTGVEIYARTGFLLSANGKKTVKADPLLRASMTTAMHQCVNEVRQLAPSLKVRTAAFIKGNHVPDGDGNVTNDAMTAQEGINNVRISKTFDGDSRVYMQIPFANDEPGADPAAAQVVRKIQSYFHEELGSEAARAKFFSSP